MSINYIFKRYLGNTTNYNLKIEDKIERGIRTLDF